MSGWNVWSITGGCWTGERLPDHQGVFCSYPLCLDDAEALMAYARQRNPSHRYELREVGGEPVPRMTHYNVWNKHCVYWSDLAMNQRSDNPAQYTKKEAEAHVKRITCNYTSRVDEYEVRRIDPKDRSNGIPIPTPTTTTERRFYSVWSLIDKRWTILMWNDKDQNDQAPFQLSLTDAKTYREACCKHNSTEKYEVRAIDLKMPSKSLPLTPDELATVAKPSVEPKPEPKPEPATMSTLSAMRTGNDVHVYVDEANNIVETITTRTAPATIIGKTATHYILGWKTLDSAPANAMARNGTGNGEYIGTESDYKFSKTVKASVPCTTIASSHHTVGYAELGEDIEVHLDANDNVVIFPTPTTIIGKVIGRSENNVIVGWTTKDMAPKNAGVRNVSTNVNYIETESNYAVAMTLSIGTPCVLSQGNKFRRYDAPSPSHSVLLFANECQGRRISKLEAELKAATDKLKTLDKPTSTTSDTAGFQPKHGERVSCRVKDVSGWHEGICIRFDDEMKYAVLLDKPVAKAQSLGYAAGFVESAATLGLTIDTTNAGGRRVVFPVKGCFGELIEMQPITNDTFQPKTGDRVWCKVKNVGWQEGFYLEYCWHHDDKRQKRQCVVLDNSVAREGAVSAQVGELATKLGITLKLNDLEAGKRVVWTEDEALTMAPITIINNSKVAVPEPKNTVADKEAPKPEATSTDILKHGNRVYHKSMGMHCVVIECNGRPYLIADQPAWGSAPNWRGDPRRSSSAETWLKIDELAKQYGFSINDYATNLHTCPYNFELVLDQEVKEPIKTEPLDEKPIDTTDKDSKGTSTTEETIDSKPIEKEEADKKPTEKTFGFVALAGMALAGSVASAMTKPSTPTEIVRVVPPADTIADAIEASAAMTTEV